MKYSISFTCYTPDREFELQAASYSIALLGEYQRWLKNEYNHPHMIVMFRGCNFKKYENEENILMIGYFDPVVGYEDWPKLTTKFKELEEKYK